MTPASVLANGADRLQVLSDLQILDTAVDPAFGVIARLACLHTSCPIGDPQSRRLDATQRTALLDLATLASAMLDARLRERHWKLLEERVSAARRAGSDWLWESDADGVLTWVSDLPDMNGFELLRRLRALPQLHGVPAFMCSADAMATDLQRARDAGFDGYWTKPIDVAAVIAELDAVARRRAVPN